MKVVHIGFPKVIMENPNSKHHYFGWPSAVRLANGNIAVGASGYRLEHVCPFGKAVLSFSADEGDTYTVPAAVIDTVLDDRDCGLTVFGNSGLIVTSFNNTVEFQRTGNSFAHSRADSAENKYCQSYLDLISKEEEERDLGTTFRISTDNGVTFGPIYHSPISSPHGPMELRDGTILWVGRIHNGHDEFRVGRDFIEAYVIDPDSGTMTFRGRIESIFEGGEQLLSCEPHAIELQDGRIVCHIRVQEQGYFTLYQSESSDGGFSWSRPEAILDKKGGAPAHLLLLSNGVLISVYGYREAPYGIRCIVSKDLGKTWSDPLVICDGYPSGDLGYPATVECEDGSLITVYYAHQSNREPAVVWQQRWRLEE